MSLPIYNPQGGSGGSFFGSIRAAASRELNKARARFWSSASTVLDKVDASIAQPALKARNTVVDTVTDAGKSVLGGLKIGTVLLVLAAGVLVFLYVRPFLPGRSK